MSDRNLRVVFVDDVVTLHEISERLNVKYQRVRAWPQRRKSNGFPRPLKRSVRVYFYSFAEVDAWHTEHMRRVEEKTQLKWSDEYEQLWPICPVCGYVLAGALYGDHGDVRGSCLCGWTFDSAESNLKAGI